ASTIIYPTLADVHAAFPNIPATMLGNDIAYPAMLRVLPAGFLGLMIAGMLAAYRSTIETHLNWGTSYLVHDFYRRFLKPGEDEQHYVMVGRLVTALLMLVATGFTLVLDSARQAFDLMLSVGAGTGLLYLLRWFWWRVNAWSEIAAMVSSFLVAVGFLLANRAGHAVPSHIALIASVVITTVIWMTTALLTEPTARTQLVQFYRLVRPAGAGWGTIPAEAGVTASPDSLAQSLLGWVLGIAFVYSALFGTGSFLYGRQGQALMWLVVFVVSGAGLLRLVPKMWVKSGG
ncbi:MAG TPA: Na+:solute symporter, partial [Gemmatimonadales bacterium]|nr:Na+:solute symporter [Gemmatimonadales bacterium]